MIDYTHWGPGKVKVLQVVHLEGLASDDGWCRLGYRAIARKAGIEERWCYELLNQVTGPKGTKRGAWLTARGHVLLIDRGRGRRPSAVRVNPRVSAWRDVCWAVDEELLELRLRQIERLARPVTAAYKVSRDVVLPRSYTAALTGFIAAVAGVPTAAIEVSNAAVLHRGKGRRAGRVNAAVPDRGNTGAMGAAYTSSSLSFKTSIEGANEEAVETQPPEALEPGTARVLHALSAALAKPVFGAPRCRLVEHLRQHPARAEALERQAATLGGIRSVPTAVAALLEWDEAAAVARPAFVVVDPVDEELDELETGSAVSKPWADLRGALDEAVRRTSADLDTPACHNGAHGNQVATEA
jgi:hypothetical protein